MEIIEECLLQVCVTATGPLATTTPLTAGQAIQTETYARNESVQLGRY